MMMKREEPGIGPSSSHSQLRGLSQAVSQDFESEFSVLDLNAISRIDVISKKNCDHV
jgi:hypothetical protein